APDPDNPLTPTLASVVDAETGRLVTFGVIDPTSPTSPTSPAAASRPLDARLLATSAVFLAAGGTQLDTPSRANAYVIRHAHSEYLPDLESPWHEKVMRPGHTREWHIFVDVAPAFNDAIAAVDYRDLLADDYARFDSMVADMNEQAVVGLVCELLAELAGEGSRPLRYAEVAVVLPALRALGGDITTELDYARAGTGLEATVGRLFAIAGSGNEYAASMLAALSPLIGLELDDISPLKLQAFRAGLRVFATTGIEAHFASTSPRILALKRGYRIAARNVYLEYPNLEVLPNDGRYSMGDVLELTATLRGYLAELEGERSFRWQLLGYGGSLDDGAGKTGTTIVTTRDTVSLKTNMSSRGTVGVEVTLLIAKDDGAPEPIDSRRVSFKENGLLEGFQDWKFINGATWLFGIVEFPKEPAAGGGFKGGRVRFERIHSDGSGYRWRDYTFPPFSGTPVSVANEPLFTEHRIQPTQSGGSGEGFDVYDYGDRLLLKVGSGSWREEAQAQAAVDFVNAETEAHGPGDRPTRAWAKGRSSSATGAVDLVITATFPRPGLAEGESDR
ncbi:MAG TPA: hypothetical protein PK095_03235, partial [Myxococcota bacterium]|nr:hypothetical protein [Myxococcota bacterium]